MHVAVVTLFPEMFAALTDAGVTGRAFKNARVALHTVNPRDFTQDVHRTVDDRPYGGGPGMVMLAEPLLQAIDSAKRWVSERTGAKPPVIYLSPQGQALCQGQVRELASQSGLVLLAGRYEGIDERVIELAVDAEVSIGDYVLSGGELPAMVLLDAVVRCLPGVLGHQDSAAEDSFEDGLLDCPHYTRPESLQGKAVPSVLLSGHHGNIRRWRYEQSLLRTAQRRPDLLAKLALSERDQRWLASQPIAKDTQDNEI